MRKLGGVSAPHFKNTAGCAPEAMPVPAEVRLPMLMHSGTPANPVVKAGDNVKVGQMIGEAAGFVSSPVHASVSGTIKSIDTLDGITGEKSVTITITSDGKQTSWEGIAPVSVTNLKEFLEAVRNSGVVGLGGAGYPTAPKFTLKETVKLDYILVNGAECEPFITSDTRTMVDETGFVWEGVLLMKEYLQPKNIIICIEGNKPEPIKKLKELCEGKEGISVRVLPSLYPQGERKVLVYNVTGRIVPEGGRLPDVGCIVVNCTTVATFAKYIKTGNPLVSKCVTVDGSAVKKPKNVIVPIGTPVRDIFAHCGLLPEGKMNDNIKKVTLGGPMMGVAIPNLDIPIVKITNAVLAFSAKDAKPPEPAACIKCGRCIFKCPMNLMPPNIENAYELKKPELLKKFKVNMCAECACCAFTCPAKRPLVQVMLLSKNMLWEYEQAQKEAKK
ncbi:MAG: electron transport complex subunit RsxC [Treponema sp.]|nr:electron transport complex subunit RsxC [Treponema sp.]MCL2272963.1 electron transport complex subunit RsxC [Treponema sp.]